MGKNDKRSGGGGGKSGGKSAGKGKGTTNFSGSGKSRHSRVEIRTAKDIAEENEEGFSGRKEDSEKHRKIDIGLYMWEFGQNDPKRDSGSKLKRLGYAKLLSK
jgi:hypothetical protein